MNPKRFVATYHWELWLFFGIPVVSGGVQHAVWELCNAGFCSNWMVPIPGAVGLALLAGSYPFVRRRGWIFLTLLWTLELVTQGVGIAARAVDVVRGAEQIRGIELFSIYFGPDYWMPITVSRLVGTVALLWFSRQASRISMGHALLIVALSSADASFSMSATFSVQPTSFTIMVAGIYLISQVGLNGLSLWAMVRLEAALAVRPAVIAVLLAAIWWSGFWIFPALLAPLRAFGNFGDVFSWGFFSSGFLAHTVSFGLWVLLPLAIVYLVRVRQSAAEAELAAEAPPALSSDG